MQASKEIEFNASFAQLWGSRLILIQRLIIVAVLIS